ncbi:MAG: tRNA pseudouridine(13) synthase TruD [Candidatus Heimdallarchaeota archaeon]|nr:tRNA pseudouridine(13) synthase TruD [Candidatus Heimdallarchaeota archaeon]
MLLESHPIEQKMGMRFYATKTNGIGGKLRETPLDFRVEEIIPDGRIISIEDKEFSFGPSEPGLFTEFILVKKNIESHNALLKITSALNRNINDITIAGTKDKMAYTAQRATIWKVSPEELMQVQISGIKIRSPRTTIYQTYLGDLKGNHFTIRIKDINIKSDDLSNHIEAIFHDIKEFNGLPNYFGHQRFGSKRPVSHKIGRFVLLGDLKRAVTEYLTYTSEDESDVMKNVRKILLDTNDPDKALAIIPKSMVFESAILKYLKKHSRDYRGAFNVLPKNLQRMFVHSYQSYIWNMSLSERMLLGNDLHKHNFDLYENNQPVLPIIGYKTELPDNNLSDYVKELLEIDSIKLKDFEVKVIPSIKFSGSYRNIILKPNNFTYGIERNENDKEVVITSFSLPSGSYATVVLREFMKINPIYF